jgi:hypothetical protein
MFFPDSPAAYGQPDALDLRNLRQLVDPRQALLPGRVRRNLQRA